MSAPRFSKGEEENSQHSCGPIIEEKRVQIRSFAKDHQNALQSTSIGEKAWAGWTIWLELTLKLAMEELNPTRRDS